MKYDIRGRNKNISDEINFCEIWGSQRGEYEDDLSSGLLRRVVW
jgi:hypothetical protein